MRRSAAIMLALVATPAAAQAPGHPAQGGGLVSQSSVSADMGRCALKRSRGAAVRILTVTGDQATREATARLRPTMVACLSGRPSATIDGVHLTGAIAEALLAENDGALLTRLAALPPHAPARVAPGVNAWRASIRCAVAGAPASAAAMLRADAATAPEMTTFRAMLPALQACVPATGDVSIKPSSARAAVAVAAYRLSAPVGAASAEQ